MDLIQSTVNRVIMRCERYSCLSFRARPGSSTAGVGGAIRVFRSVLQAAAASHAQWIEQEVQLGGVEPGFAAGDFANGGPAVRSEAGDTHGRFVAQLRGQRRRQGQTVLDEFPAALAIGDDSGHAAPR